MLRLIGQGSYGDVWLARGVTGLYRAIKVVRRDRFPDRGPFEREFRGLTEFAAHSSGDSIQLALLHVGKNDDAGFFYYVMELADDAEHGRAIDPAAYVPLTLAELRRRRGRLPAGECLTFAVELARELASLHRHGLVHRDIKPSNIILVDGRPKLADIGLVAPVNDARTFIGTEGFVPPEGPGTPSADVFALGRVLYELSTGRDQREFPQLPECVGDLPDCTELMTLNRIVLRACERYPEQRYKDGSELLTDLEAEQSGGENESRRFRFSAGIVIAVLLTGIVVIGLAGRRIAKPTAPPPDAAAESQVRGIAVLPFASLSATPSDALLAEGIHDDVMNRLNLVRELRVVSRTSVMAFKNSGKTAAQIASVLGVQYLLEGTVRREQQRLRVSSRLIDANGDRQVWSESYDRPVSDLFAVQTELANSIAQALTTVIRPETTTLLRRRPTENIDAYEAYLKGRQAIERGPGNETSAEPFFEAAVALDPNLVPAWCALVEVHSAKLFNLEDRSPARQRKAAFALEQVQRLAPGTAECIRAIGTYQHLALRNYAQAAEQFDQLRRLLPNDGSVYFLLGGVQWRQNRFAEALGNRRRAVELDPANRQYSAVYRNWLGCARRWPELVAEQRRICALWPNVLSHFPRVSGPLADQLNIVIIEHWIARSPAPLEAFVAQCPPEYRDCSAILYAKARLAWYRADFDELRRIDGLLPEPASEDPELSCESALEFASYYSALGGRQAGIARLRDAPELVRRMVAQDPASPWAWAYLGRVEALLGNSEAAIRAAKESVRLLPETQDLSYGTAISLQMAITFAWAGEADFALTELARLITMPTNLLSGQYLKVRWEFFPLRGDPRFEALIKDPKNDEPLF